jgi:hypothetical protein
MHMQSQEHQPNHSYHSQEQIFSDQREINLDPREQPAQSVPHYAFRPYEEGYAELDEGHIWREGEKLRPTPSPQKGMGGLLLIAVLLCAAFLAGSLFSVILHGLVWIIVAVLIVAAAIAITRNWRVVTVPIGVRTFQIAERARLTIGNASGNVVIRRGEPGVVSVAATKRASGIGVHPERIQVSTEQFGDTLNISTRMDWSFLELSLRNVDFEITVPTDSDIQLDNGSGRIVVQGASGDIRVRTGSGRIEARDLQGQIALKTGSGRIELNNLQGQIFAKTGSGSIQSSDLQGPTTLRTGSGGLRVSGLQGVATLKTGSGSVAIDHSELIGESSLRTGSGSIAFEGTLEPYGDSVFRTGSGAVNVRLSADTAFSLNARTGSGGVVNEFGGNEVGSGARARLKLRTGSGRIHIAKMFPNRT